MLINLILIALSTLPFELDIDHPWGMTVHQGQLYVSDNLNGMLYQISLEDGVILESKPAPVQHPSAMVSDGQNLYVCDGSDNRIVYYNPTNDQTTREIYSFISEPGDLAWDGAHLWLIDNKAKEIAQIDTADGTILKRLGKYYGVLGGLDFNEQIKLGWNNEDMIGIVSPENGKMQYRFPAKSPFITAIDRIDGLLIGLDALNKRIVVLEPDLTARLWQSDSKTVFFDFRVDVSFHGVGALDTALIYIAIPQNDDYQTITEPVTFSIQPSDKVADKWGQTLAVFQIVNQKSPYNTTISMSGKATTYKVNYNLAPQISGSWEDIPKELMIFTQDATKYMINSEELRKTAVDLKKKSQRPLDFVINVIDAVQNKIDYELAEGWNAAPEIWSSGKGSCSEFVFVFNAICRAGGLPARYVGAYNVVGPEFLKDNVFHRWSEVYIPGLGWIPVDPSIADPKANPPNLIEISRSIGGLNNQYIISTKGGGDSEYLQWGYHVGSRSVITGQGQLVVDYACYGNAEPKAIEYESVKR